jgi:uncharacterized membrane protein YeiH
MKEEIFTIIDIVGTAAFSISGVFAGMKKKLDLFGIFIVAFITAIGGGTIRDILIGDFPVSWMRTGNYSLVILVSAAVALLFYKVINNYEKTLMLFDSIGLGFFTVLGIKKAMAFGFSPGLCIALGTITACFGGLIRDIILNEIPHILQKEIYATACIIGGAVFLLLNRTSLSPEITDVIVILLIVMIRLVAIRKNWSLPGVYK